MPLNRIWIRLFPQPRLGDENYLGGPHQAGLVRLAQCKALQVACPLGTTPYATAGACNRGPLAKQPCTQSQQRTQRHKWQCKARVLPALVRLQHNYTTQRFAAPITPLSSWLPRRNEGTPWYPCQLTTSAYFHRKKPIRIPITPLR